MILLALYRAQVPLCRLLYLEPVKQLLIASSSSRKLFNKLQLIVELQENKLKQTSSDRDASVAFETGKLITIHGPYVASRTST